MHCMDCIIAAADPKHEGNVLCWSQVTVFHLHDCQKSSTYNSQGKHLFEKVARNILGIGIEQLSKLDNWLNAQLH